MIREAIGIGETEELAKNDALKQLGVQNDNGVEFEIIKKAEKKRFGLFGGSPAKVKAFINIDEDIKESFTEEQNADKGKAPVKDTDIDRIVEKSFAEPDTSSAEAVKDEIDDNTAADVQTESNAHSDYEPAKEAKAYVERVLEAMGLDEIIVEMTEDENSAEIRLSGEQIGAVIGRRGETLDSLQYLAGLVANHTGNSYFRVTVNTGNYREKREKTLEVLGRKLAFKVLKTGRNVSLEPMNPYERRIIHTAVQKVNGVISWSEGEVINRHVVIGPDPEYKRSHHRSGGYNGRGGRKNYNNSYDRKKSYNNNKRRFNSDNNNNTETKKSEREPKNEGEKFSLYGRVDTKK